MPYITQENYKKTTICFDFSGYSDCSSFTIRCNIFMHYLMLIINTTAPGTSLQLSRYGPLWYL